MSVARELIAVLKELNLRVLKEDQVFQTYRWKEDNREEYLKSTDEKTAMSEEAVTTMRRLHYVRLQALQDFKNWILDEFSKDKYGKS